MYADEHKKLSQVKIIYIYIYIVQRDIYSCYFLSGIKIARSI